MLSDLSVDLMKSFQSLKNLLPIQKISKKELMNFFFFTSTEAQSGECTTLYSEYLKGKIENKEKIIASLIEQWTFVRSLYNKYLDLSETLSIPVRIQKKDLTFTIQSVKSHYEFITVSGFFHQHLENTYYQFPPFSLEIKDNFASFHIRTQETEFEEESAGADFVSSTSNDTLQGDNTDAPVLQKRRMQGQKTYCR